MGITSALGPIGGTTETGTAPGATEHNASGLTRGIATVFTHTASADTGSVAKTFVYGTSGSLIVGRSFLSNSQVFGAGTGRGNFAFFVDQLNGGTGYNLASTNDSLAITYNITFATVP